MSTPTKPPLASAQGQAKGPASPQSPQRTAPPADMFGNRRPIGGLGVPMQKAKDFRGTLLRLLSYLRPHRTGLIVVIVAGAIGTVFQVLGPKILGMATTKIFEGF